MNYRIRNGKYRKVNDKKIQWYKEQAKTTLNLTSERTRISLCDLLDIIREDEIFDYDDNLFY